METAEKLLLNENASKAASEAKNGIAQTALLVVANCAGAGILSLPKAVTQAGLTTGSLMILGAAIISAYTAMLLGRCYNIIEQREGYGTNLDDEEDEDAQKEQTSFFARSPYAAMGQKAAGTVGVVAVSVAQVSTQFSVMVLFFLISGINLNHLAPQRSSLFFSLLCTGVLTPLMLLRPGHVWGTALFAIAASVILVVVIIILCATNAPHDPYTHLPPVTFSSFGTAFGVILFGFGGHAILPALQATMIDPTPVRFRQAIIWSFAVCTAMYLSTSIGSVIVLGGTVSGDVLTNFSGWINSFGLIAVTIHLLFAAVTVHIPLGQICDHYAAATDFSARQICIRVATMALVAVMIWLIGDHFFCVIGLVGGTCNNAMIFIFPPWFYLKLMKPDERTPLMTAKMCLIMFIGTAGMVSALIGAVDSC